MVKYSSIDTFSIANEKPLRPKLKQEIAQKKAMRERK